MIRLTNTTKWDTKDLRMLCKKVIENSGSDKRHQIEIVPSKHHYSGRARVLGYWIKMRVPPPTKKRYSHVAGSDGKTKLTHEIVPREFDVVDFAQVLEHEIGHNMGLRHGDMCSVGNINVDYVKGIIVRPKLGGVQ